MKTSRIFLSLIAALFLGTAAAEPVGQPMSATNSPTYAQVWAKASKSQNVRSHLSVSEWRMMVEILLEKCTELDDTNAVKLLLDYDIGLSCYKLGSLEECRKLDEKLCKYDIDLTEHWLGFPKTCAHFKQLHPDYTTPVSWRALEAMNNPHWVTRSKYVGAEAVLIYFNAQIDRILRGMRIDVRGTLDSIQWIFTLNIKNYIEATGGYEGYLQRNENPYQVLQEEFHKVVNSPKLKGMDRLYRLCAGAEWMEPSWPPEQKIEEMKGRFISGEMDSVIDEAYAGPQGRINVR